MTHRRFSKIAAFTAVLALAVIMLGAYVRLSDAGLGCPDWPGCYGRIGAPTSESAIEQANSAFPQRPVETAKAWKEMVHRYLASTLGFFILILSIIAWRNRSHSDLPLILPSILLALVIFQGLLGMWTVTLLVNPSIVTAHLLGGLATLGLLSWLALRGLDGSQTIEEPIRRRFLPWAWLALFLIIAQITLGGWTSTHYAALACTDFPRCHGGQWWPPSDFRAGFTIWKELGVNYEFGTLDSAARTAIHLTHRIGAAVVLVYVGVLALLLMRHSSNKPLTTAGQLILASLLIQIGLGIANVLGHLPLGIAVAHNGGAALLLVSIINLLHRLTPWAIRKTEKSPSPTTNIGERV